MIVNNYSWVCKYKPIKLTDFSFKNNNHLQALKWLKNYNSKSKFLLINGQSGIGKTCLIYTISRIFKYNVIEFNGGDEKTVLQAQNIILQCKTQSVSMQKNLFLIDEIDCFGDLNFYLKIFSQIGKLRVPIIFCTNNYNNTVLYRYKNNFEILNLSVDKKDAIGILSRIVKSENIKVEIKVLHLLVNNSNCDIRSCVKNLKMLVKDKQKYIIEKDVKFLRNGSKNLFKICEDVFNLNLREN
ncbi:hypothetical protein GVAV_000083 [Gurleya vavrai]